VLESKIQSPFNEQQIKTVTTILGVARGAGFAQYKLEYGAGSTPSTWTVLQTATAPTSGKLGTFDPSTVGNGTYTIRPTTSDTQGQLLWIEWWWLQSLLPLPARCHPTRPLQRLPTNLESCSLSWARRRRRDSKILWQLSELEVYPIETRSHSRY
jgi:hypothetical protein